MVATRKLQARLAALWSVPVYLPYLQPPLTDKVVARAEAKLGVRLPSAYIAALRVQNGGYVRFSQHPRGDAPVDCIWGIGPRFPSVLKHDWDDIKSYMAEEGIRRPRDIDGLIPFCGDGHVHYCFDYRQGGRRREPRISYIDVETFDTDKSVAPDFGTFLVQLRAEKRDAIAIVTRDPIAKVVAAVEKASRVTLEDQGDQDGGYRMFRAALPKKTWAWVEANTTRRGFVRRADPEYGRLKNKLTEDIDRFSEHADCGYFLHFSEPASPAAQRFVRALAKLPYPTRAVELDS